MVNVVSLSLCSILLSSSIWIVQVTSFHSVVEFNKPSQQWIRRYDSCRWTTFLNGSSDTSVDNDKPYFLRKALMAGSY
jgi:hypothetical protein